jgi:hypothetical protein
MQRRTLCCPLQMVQYFSQVQRSSGKSHCAQWVGPCMGASPKTVPEHGTPGQGEGESSAQVTQLLVGRTTLSGEYWVSSDNPTSRADAVSKALATNLRNIHFVEAEAL